MIHFQHNDPSLESQWRAIILFGQNSATYKFAFAKSLLELISEERTSITLSELAKPFALNIAEHLEKSDKQGNSKSSKFLEACRDYNKNHIGQEQLFKMTEKLGFVNVVDAFHNVNGESIPSPFYQKEYSRKTKKLVITDNLLKLKESFHFQNFHHETEARWNLVETAWNLQISPSLLEVKYEEELSSLYLEENRFMKRIDITSAREALNGYQKGKCFYSFMDISIETGSPDVCHVDHFLPHTNKRIHHSNGGDINGVWNLVLSHSAMNSTKEKGAKIPEIRFLERLHRRNEFYINSKHPLAETIINQTGKNEAERKSFLQRQYDIALSTSIARWRPSLELPASF